MHYVSSGNSWQQGAVIVISQAVGVCGTLARGVKDQASYKGYHTGTSCLDVKVFLMPLYTFDINSFLSLYMYIFAGILYRLWNTYEKTGVSTLLSKCNHFELFFN